MIHTFGEFELDEALYELRRGRQLVKLEPKVFDVLVYLVRARARVVSKDDLLDALWPGEHVSESVLPRCIAAARKALGDSPAGRKFIQTVHGRGYRFVAAVAERNAAASPGATADAGTGGERARDAGSGPDAPSLAGEVAGDQSASAALGVFVGREEAMAQLHGALERALAGHGQLVLLLGEPGIGKTRTAEELAATARRRGARTLTGRCYEGEGAPSFWPWVQILRALAGACDPVRIAAEIGPGLADLAQLVPELAPRRAAGDQGRAAREHVPGRAAAAGTFAPELAGPGSPATRELATTSEQARFRLFDSVATLLKRAGRAEPLVVVLDDLHWADKPSLLLLQFLARDLRDARLLLIGTYRDVALGRHHPLAETLGELARESACQRVALRGLAAADVARFIELASGRAPSERVAAAVYEMTEGNPFFIGEIVRVLAAEGRLERPEETAWGVMLPQGVREAIGRRLDALSDECNRVLSLASVIGRDFRLSVLTRLAELDGQSLLALLDEAVGARVLVVGARAGEHAFSHALIRETLYEELTSPARVGLHRRVGEALEAVYGAEVEAHLPELAHHFFEAASGGDPTKAIAYACRAAERALQLLAYEEAASHYDRALQAAELKVPPDDTLRCELLLGLGDAQSRSGERAQMRTAFQRAAEIARRLGRPDLLARAALGFGGRSEAGSGRDEAVRALVEEALAALGEGDDALRACLLSRLTGTEPYAQSMETRAALSRQAVELARRAGDPMTLVAALSARYWALLGPDHLDERFAVGDELLTLADETRDKSTGFLGREVRLGVFLVRGDIAAADRELEIMAALAEELRQPVERWFVTWLRASRAIADGRFEEGERWINEGFAMGQRAQHPAAIQAFGGQMLWLRGEQGRLEELGDVEASFRALLEIAPSGGGQAILRTGVANFYGDLGQMEAAREEFEALAAKDFADLPRDEHWLVTMVMLAEVCCDLGDTRRAALLYELLLPFAALNALHDLIRAYRGSVALPLGKLAATMGRYPEAVRHFEAALAMNRRMGTRPYVVRAQSEYARMLLDRGHAKDLPRVRALLDEAVTAAREMEMKRGLATALALRERAAGTGGEAARTAGRAAERPRARR